MSKPSSLADDDIDNDDVAETGACLYQSPTDRSQEIWIQELARGTPMILDSKLADDDLDELFDNDHAADTDEQDDDADTEDKVQTNKAKKRRVQRERRVAVVADLPPQLLTFLPADTVVGNIMEYLSVEDLQRYCRAEPMFAYRFCGVARRATFPAELDDTRVAWRLWKNLLARDFGISDNANECSDDSVYFREMTASAVRIFIAHELNAGFSAPLAALEPNRARLLAYKHLYALLYNSTRGSVIHTANFHSDTTGLEHIFTLGTNIVVVAMDYNGEWAGYIVTSVVALISAHEDVIEGRDTLTEILYSLHKGQYGAVFESAEQLEPTTRGAFRSINGVYLVPRARWATLQDNEALEPVLVGGAQKVALYQLEDLFLLLPTLNDAGGAIMFCVHRGNPLDQMRNLVIEQYSADSHAMPNDAISLTQRAELNDVGDEQRDTYLPMQAETEKTYMTFACQWATRDELFQPLRNRLADDDIFRRAWYPRDTVLQIRKFADNRLVFRLAIDELVQQHNLPAAKKYRISATACVHRLPDGSFAGSYIIFVSVFRRGTPDNDARLLRSYHLIKVNLNDAGDPQSVKLYVVPRIFVEAMEINFISSRYSSIAFDQYAIPKGETAVFDWERSVVIYIPRALVNPFNRQPVNRIMVPTLAFTNYHLTQPRLVRDNGTGNYYSSDIQMYDQALLVPIDLFFASVTKHL
jgi:hypothetical protein